jgi:hypothetical protein
MGTSPTSHRSAASQHNLPQQSMPRPNLRCEPFRKVCARNLTRSAALAKATARHCAVLALSFLVCGANIRDCREPAARRRISEVGRSCFHSQFESILETRVVKQKQILPALLALLALTGCGTSETQAERDQNFSRKEDSLDVAQRNATLQCDDQPQCDAVWKLTATYVEQHSDTAVVRADAVAVDTDLPTRGGRVSFSATRVPKGSGATITLYAQCRGMYGLEKSKGSSYDNCVDKVTSTQNKFADFVSQNVRAN